MPRAAQKSPPDWQTRKTRTFFEGATPDALATELEDRDYYKSVNVFWVPEAACWKSLRAAAKLPDISQ